jgi:succinate dehydrogenase/fumarate reductase-like Fe-S protein
LSLVYLAECKAERENYKILNVKHGTSVLSARSSIPQTGRIKMSKFFLLMACILTGLLVLACSSPTNRNAEAPSGTNSAAAPAGTPSTTTNRNANAVSGGDHVGIAECENFINAYEACVSGKVPEQARASLKASVATWRTEWKKLADNPQTRGTLAAACTRQREQTMTAMKAYNCTW